MITCLFVLVEHLPANYYIINNNTFISAEDSPERKKRDEALAADKDIRKELGLYPDLRTKSIKK